MSISRVFFFFEALPGGWWEPDAPGKPKLPTNDLCRQGEQQLAKVMLVFL